MDHFTWTQTTASQYAKWYASKVSNPLNIDKVEPEDFIKHEANRIITKDGVSIELGDTVYVIDDEFNCWKRKLILGLSCKFFSTKQKALDYITFNKPVLALKDVQEILVFQRNPDLINELVKICHERCHGLNKDK